MPYPSVIYTFRQVQTTAQSYLGTLTCKKGLELELGVCDKTRQSGSLLKDLNTCLRVIYERGVDEPYLMSNIFQKGKCKGCCQEEICNEYRMFAYT